MTTLESEQARAGQSTSTTEPGALQDLETAIWAELSGMGRAMLEAAHSGRVHGRACLWAAHLVTVLPAASRVVAGASSAGFLIGLTRFIRPAGLIGLCGLIGGSPALALAGPGPAGDCAPASTDDSARPLVLFSVSEASPESGSSLDRDLARALRTELNDVDVELEQVSLAPRDDLESRVLEAEETLEDQGALAVVWVEVGEGPGRLEVYLVAEGGMVRRSIGEPEGERGVAVETAAVVLRYFIADLVGGRTIGLGPSAREVEDDLSEGREVEGGGESGASSVAAGTGGEGEGAVTGVSSGDDDDRGVGDPGSPEGPDPALGLGHDRGTLELQVAYLGQTWARERAWSNTAELGVGWRLPSGVDFGLGYQIVGRYADLVQYPGTISGGVAVDLRRHPFAAYAGYRHRFKTGRFASRLTVGPQLRLITELVTRSLRDFADPTLTTGAPSTVGLAVEPRLALEWIASPHVAVFLAAGLRVAVIRRDYALVYTRDSEVVESVTYLHTRGFAPTAVAGLEIFL